MAQAFFKKYAPDMDSYSAGTRPADRVSSVVVRVMHEIGIDISQNRPKMLSGNIPSDYTLINMGCIKKDACPALLHHTVLEWNIADPKGKSIEDVRNIRNSIESHVQDLVSGL